MERGERTYREAVEAAGFTELSGTAGTVAPPPQPPGNAAAYQQRLRMHDAEIIAAQRAPRQTL